MRSLIIAACIALSGCAGRSDRASDESHLTLALADGTEVHARAGEITFVPLVAFGAQEATVTWSVADAPPFVAVTSIGLRIAPALADPAAASDIVVTASAGDESVSRTIRLVVEPSGVAPVVAYWGYKDGSPWGWCVETERAADDAETVACLDRPSVQVAVADPSMQGVAAVGVEVEAVLAASPFTGTATHRSELYADWTRGGDSVTVAFDVPLDGLELGRRYRVAVRAYGALGATESWRELPERLVRSAYVLRPSPNALGSTNGSLYVPPGSSATFGFVAGDLPTGVDVVVTDLPRTLAPQVNRGELTITMPADTPMKTFYLFGVSLASGEVVMTQRTAVFTYVWPPP